MTPDTPKPPPTPEPPPEAVDVEASADLEKSLLKRRQGKRESFLTRGLSNRKSSNQGSGLSK